jgi:esterase/lipase superfamily enzyme
LAAPPLVAAQSADLLRAYQRFETAKAAKQTADALQSGEEALRLAEADGTDPQYRVELLRSLGDYAAQRGEDDRAVRFDQRALALQEAILNHDDPDLVPVLSALADLAVKDKRYADAESLLQRVLDIERAAYGNHHDNVLATLGKLREVYRATNNIAGIARVETEMRPPVAHPRGLPGPAVPRRYDARQGFATVRVLYGTNRAVTGSSKPALLYGTAREHGALHYGYLDVTIPQKHQEAELETQSRWAQLLIDVGDSNTRRKYVLLDSVTQMPQNEFLRTMRQQIKDAPSKDVFIFVHGFNVSFEDAARRTAQMAYDLDFSGTPMMFSWPSQSSITAYFADEAAVNDSGYKMAEFLDTVVTQSGARHIHLIAHSMGNRALIEALQTFLSRRAPDRRERVFGQIVFTAPDVDRDYFTDAMQSLRGAADRVTLYASSNDYALRTSQFFHHAPRAGTAGDVIVRMAGLDTIDMSAVKADLLGHSYFAANAGAIADIFRLFWRGDPPPRRCGMNDRKTSDSLTIYWFDVKMCEGDALLQAAWSIKRYGERAHDYLLAKISASTDPSQKHEWQNILQQVDGLMAQPAVPTAPGMPK